VQRFYKAIHYKIIPGYNVYVSSSFIEIRYYDIFFHFPFNSAINKRGLLPHLRF
jgi:hypothetical protein